MFTCVACSLSIAQPPFDLVAGGSASEHFTPICKHILMQSMQLIKEAVRCEAHSINQASHQRTAGFIARPSYDQRCLSHMISAAHVYIFKHVQYSFSCTAGFAARTGIQSCCSQCVEWRQTRVRCHSINTVTPRGV